MNGDAGALGRSSSAAHECRKLTVIEQPASALSELQHRIWMFSELNAAESVQYIPLLIDLAGRLDIGLLTRALDCVIERHEALRSGFALVDGEPKARVHAFVPDLLGRGLTCLDAESVMQVRAALRERMSRALDLAIPPLFEAVLFRVGPVHHQLFLRFHHLIFDGQSAQVLLDDLFSFYRTVLSSGAPVVEPVTSVRVQASADERSGIVPVEPLSRAPRVSDKACQLPPTSLLGDVGHPLGERFACHIEYFQLDETDSKALREQARSSGVSLFMHTFAVFAALVSRRAGEEWVSINIPVAGRHDRDRLKQIGCLASVRPVELRIDVEATFADLLGQVKRKVLDTYLGALPALTQPNGSAAGGWGSRGNGILFQVAEPFPLVLLPGPLQVRSDLVLEAGLSQSIYDLSVSLSFCEGRLHGRFLYHQNSYSQGYVQELAEEFSRGLISASTAQVRTLTDRWSQHADHGPDGRTSLAFAHGDEPADDTDLLVEFKRQTQMRPDEIAIAWRDSSLSYRDLSTEMQRFASWFAAAGVDEGALVAVLLPRSPDLVAAVLAVLELGAAYVPVDPELPEKRIHQILDDADPKLILTTVESAAKVAPALRSRTLDIAAIKHDPSRQPPSFVSNQLKPIDHVAYVIYTSGSTGTPKGVAVTRANLSGLLQAMVRLLAAGPELRCLALTTISFDIAMLDLYLPLVVGGRLVLTDECAGRDPDVVASLVATQGVTLIQTTPSRWRHLLLGNRTVLAGVTALAGGEELPVDLARTLAQSCRNAWNVYGPTECTVWATAGKIESNADAPAAIGRPLVGVTVHVLDRFLRPLPRRVVGELYISGDLVARGYHGRPGLTAERFVACPFGPSGSRMYRTGDLVRMLADGALEYVGRSDGQLKLHGSRAELAEIEASLRALDEVVDCALTTYPSVSGTTLLAACVVIGAGQQRSAADVRAALAARLPHFMIPSAVVIVDRLPLSGNGKLDRNALLELVGSAVETGSGSDIETRLLHVFRTVLEQPDLSVSDNFFDVGGNSIAAVRILAEVRERLAIDLDIADIFCRPTVVELAAMLDRSRVPANRRGEVQDEWTVFQLSNQQRQFWFLESTGGPWCNLNVPVAVRITGLVDVGELRRCLRGVLARHSALRTVIEQEGDEVRQRILPVSDCAPELITGDCHLGEFEIVLKLFAGHVFDLRTEMPFRAALWQLRDDEYVLGLLAHHIACDGMSMKRVCDEVAADYNGGSDQAESPSFPETSYAEYVCWQQKPSPATAELVASDLRYWLKALAGLPLQTRLPIALPPATKWSYQGASVEFEVPADVHARLVGVASSFKASPFMVVLAAFSHLLCRYGAGDDLAIGVPSAGRIEAAHAGIVGNFADALVMRMRLAGMDRFGELIEQARSVSLAALSHQHVSFNRIVQEINPERSALRHPLFQVMLNYNELRVSAPELRNLRTCFEPLEIEVARVALTMGMEARYDHAGRPAGFRGRLRYALILFDRRMMDLMVQEFVGLLDVLSRVPDVRLSHVRLPSRDDNSVASASNGDSGRDRADASIVDHFDRQVLRTPHAPALQAQGLVLSYRELSLRVQRMAQRIAELNLPSEAVVALLLERSVDLIVTLLAVLKSGCAYLPLSLRDPAERWSRILVQCQPALVICHGRTRERLDGASWSGLRLDLDADRAPMSVNPVASSSQEAIIDPDQLAYVMYTSGSTGAPKGVAVSHRAVVGLALEGRWRDGRHARVLFHSPHSFDASVYELFVPLLSGGCVVVAPAGDQVEELIDLIGSGVASAVWLTAGLFALIADETPTTLRGVRIVLAGGDVLSPAAVRRVLEHCPGLSVVNAYGPTEATTFSTCHEVTSVDHVGEVCVPIGSEMESVQIHVLDSHLQPVAGDAVGELYLSGVGLARGYLGLPALTAQRFVACPFASPGQRMYRTGDLVRREADGQIRFVGRVDAQLKIRGFRVEPAEIERVILAHALARRCLVVNRPTGPADSRLVAYVILDRQRNTSGQPLEILREHSRQCLPDYMVPHEFVELASFPLTENQKVDLARLPPAGGITPATATATAPMPRPGGELESTLCGIYASVLNLADIGPDDRFFDLGGNSLSVVRLVQRIRGLDVPVAAADIFECQTPAGLANLLVGRGADAAIGSAAVAEAQADPIVALRVGGSDGSIYCMHTATGVPGDYNGLLPFLSESLSVFALQDPALTGEQFACISFEQMVQRYTQAILAHDGNGPYRLLGWSYGGLVAHAVATRLQTMGRGIELLAVLDAYPGRITPPHPMQSAARDILYLSEQRLVRNADLLATRAVARLIARGDSRFSGLGEAGVLSVIETYASNLKFGAQFKPERFSGDLMIFAATHNPEADPHKWRPYVSGQIQSIAVDCDHAGMLDPDIAKIVGARVNQQIERVEFVPAQESMVHES